MPEQPLPLPAFHHSELDSLYKKGLYIEETVLQAILDLDRPTLIADLELILKDSTQNYTAFEAAYQEGPGYDFGDAPLHALMLLGELKATEALPAILAWLSGDEAFLEFWLGDHLTATIWEPIYKLLPDETGLTENFLKKQGLNQFAQAAVADALVQLALHRPEQRPYVVELFKRVFEQFNETPASEGEDFISLLVNSAVELTATELIPVISDLYDKGLLDDFMAGSKEETLADLQHHDRNYLQEVLGIIERYRHITTHWAGYKDDEEKNDWTDWEEDEKQEPIRVAPKTGRNDPCPCGSGKKYKKCCLSKEE